MCGYTACDVSERRFSADRFRRLSTSIASCRVLATGSSTLAAFSKFRDTLTGRKRNIWLTPMTLADMRDFSTPDLKHRLLHGGLPPFFLSKRLPERDFQEWMDDYWSKDIQELFRLESRRSFQRFVELILAQSGGMFEASSLATPCTDGSCNGVTSEVTRWTSWRPANARRRRRSSASGEPIDSIPPA